MGPKFLYLSHPLAFKAMSPTSCRKIKAIILIVMLGVAEGQPVPLPSIGNRPKQATGSVFQSSRQPSARMNPYANAFNVGTPLRQGLGAGALPVVRAGATPPERLTQSVSRRDLFPWMSKKPNG